jgi:hypothetical protein
MTTSQYVVARKATAMVDWTILSPTFLKAMVEWAGAYVTVLAIGQGHSTNDPKEEKHDD